ncbi:putative sulfate exporter family transporter [Pedobacter sp. HMWF019]|uniref:YeiH family protein n=1 Tax=Pedobacter sp. HMWF019 TaxID=2056856 RepID=UPI000D334C29|nr:putative sulfate exporter family transporter [Pedobacter sp. HMWF019]PTT02155.1 putative sulfate exporter family transporter [Pedobacter sp. HMWF019]
MKLIQHPSFPKFLYFCCAIVCLLPWMSPPLALLLGIFFAQIADHPLPVFNQKATQLLLKISVVGLGFGMNVYTAMKVGMEGFLFTIVSITSILGFGYLLMKLLKINPKTSFLISAGTAICGGSAIAALSPVMKANEKQISVALGTVFILNSVALFIFPVIGHIFNLSQTQFGMWCAIAIHDTSSVVGAASKYGNEALQIATTVKLARALWIIPVALGTAMLFKTAKAKIQIPYFIGLFVMAMLANTYFTQIHPWTPYLLMASKAGLTLTLFFIGSGLSLAVIKSVGFRPLLQGVSLWLFISMAALGAILII